MLRNDFISQLVTGRLLAKINEGTQVKVND